MAEQKKSKKIRLKSKPVAKTTAKKGAKTKTVKTVTTPVKKTEKVSKTPVVIVQEPKAQKPIVVNVPAPEVKKAKPIEVSRPFFATIIVMIIIFYMQIIAGLVVYFNYDVHFTQLHTRPAYTQTQKIRNVRRYPKGQKATSSKTTQQRKRNVRRRRTSSAATNSTTATNALIRPQEPKAKIDAPKPAVQCPPRVERKVVFNEAEYAPFAQGGDAVIEGALCVPLKDGSTKCLANTSVFINPVTSYSDEWYARAWAGRENLQIADERAFRYNITTQTDKNGRFKFENLKPGSYYVGAAVCVPEGKDSVRCQYTRFGTKVTMKRLVKTELKQVYP